MAARKQAAKRAERNRTIEIRKSERSALRRKLIKPTDLSAGRIRNSIIHGDAMRVLPLLKANSIDLLFADPPYNLSKSFGTRDFKQVSADKYEDWIESWLKTAVSLLKPTASVYICGDWRSASAIQRVGSRYLTLRNRITWEREKGRGARKNWKNASEDIWFFTASDEYYFDPDSVKVKRRVIAPYRENGKPKDWSAEESGNYRLTGASNIWTDLTVPFWSMSENTDHPTQKPEKLLAKIILASSRKDDLILDPFAGSGTSAAAATKLGRDFICIESEEHYCLFAAKRIELAKTDKEIQGFSGGVFWDRNSQIAKKK